MKGKNMEEISNLNLNLEFKILKFLNSDSTINICTCTPQSVNNSIV